MTCTSDRSGSASSGVRSTATMPATMMNSVASRTRKRLRPDHSMTLANSALRSSVTGVLIGLGCRAGRLDRDDDPLALATLDELEVDGQPGLQLLQDRLVGGLELHGHGRPLQARHRAVRDARGAGPGIDFLDLASGPMADPGSGRLVGCPGGGGAADSRLQIALGIEQEIGRHPHPLALTHTVKHLDPVVAARPEPDLPGLEAPL